MLFKSDGPAVLLSRDSFTAPDGQVVHSVQLYDPSTAQTFQLFGPTVALVTDDVQPMESINVTLEWRFSRTRGWRPRLVAVSQ